MLRFCITNRGVDGGTWFWVVCVSNQMILRCWFAFFVGLLLCVVCSVSAQERGNWRKELETFEKVQARLLLPVQEILFSELSARQQAAAKGSDLRLEAELEARVAIAKQENDLLKEGRILHASRENDQKTAFVHAGSGRQWKLRGTKNVPRVGLCRGGIRSFSLDGHELGDLAGLHFAPGVFGGRRRQDSGWNCFAFSADLQFSQCLIVSDMVEGVCLSKGKARPIPVSESKERKEASVADQNDLLALLEARYRQKMLQHEAVRRSLIESFISAPNTPAGDMRELREILLEATEAHELLSRPASRSVLEVETPAAFLERLSGSEWQISDMPSLSRLRFDGLMAYTLPPSGQGQERLSATLEWPGLLRLKPAGELPVLMAFGPDLDRVLVLRVRSTFPGQLVE